MLLRIIHSIIIHFLGVTGLAISIQTASFFAPFSKPRTKPYQIAGRIWGRFVLAISRVKVSVSGLENIPREQAMIFAANHQSSFDAILTLACIPVNLRYQVLKRYFKLPVFGRGWRKCGYIPVTRDSPLSFYQVFKKTVEALKEGESILIFPEGFRTSTGELGKFNYPSLLPALEASVPVVPVAISGSFKVMPRGSLIIRPHPVKFSIGKAVYIRSKEEYPQKLEEIRDAIAKMQ
ncbi:MAG: lysophospholipid acyltransferase family protein [Candidatus Margulisiibacteriota bacterium]